MVIDNINAAKKMKLMPQSGEVCIIKESTVQKLDKNLWS